MIEVSRLIALKISGRNTRIRKTNVSILKVVKFLITINNYDFTSLKTVNNTQFYKKGMGNLTPILIPPLLCIHCTSLVDINNF